MGLGINYVIRANHLVSLITSSITNALISTQGNLVFTCGNCERIVQNK